MNIRVEGIQLMGLYLFFRRHEDELDENLLAVLDQVQETLYSAASIDQIEEMETLYRQNVDLFAGSKTADGA